MARAAAAGLAVIALLAGSRGLAAEPLEAGRALAVSQEAIGRPIEGFALTDADGKRVSLADYRGKPLVVSFVYTGCSQVCPTTTRFLARAVREARSALGPGGFNVASIGFNVPYDNPVSMRAFAKQNGIDDAQWSLLVPDAASRDALLAAFGFSLSPSAGGFDHLTQVTVLDGKGVVYRQVYGESFELPMLVAPLRELALGQPMPAPKIADWIERVRILCTVYDPRSGKYRLNYGLFIEIGVGVLCLGATLWYLLGELRRYRRRNRASRTAPRGA